MFYFITISIIAWLTMVGLDKGSDVLYAKRGGGGQPSPPPTPAPPPTPQETTREAIQAQIDALPQQLAAQEEFGPQFTQQQLDSVSEFGPKFAQEAIDLEAEFGPQIAEQAKLQQDILDPSRAAGSDAITEFIEAGPQGLTEDDIRAIEQSSRSAAASRGLSSSGFSAKDEILKNFGARQQLKSRFLDVSLSAAGRLPAAAASTTSTSAAAGGPGQLVQNVNPSQFFGAQASNNAFNSSIFGTQGAIFGAQSKAATARREQNIALGSDIVGGGLALAGCWVASEIFGSWGHPKTVAARHYINNLGPKWFKDFYLKHGEQFAQFISDKPIIKMLIRPVFEVFAVKGGFAWVR